MQNTTHARGSRWAIAVATLTVLMGLVVLLARPREVFAANGETDFTHTVSQPTRNGEDEITVTVESDGVTSQQTVSVVIAATDTPQSKAVKYAAAINAIQHVDAAPAQSIVAIAGEGAADTVKKVEIKRKNEKTASGQKRKRIGCTAPALVANFEVEGPATGVSLDQDPAEVRVGTARGVASVATVSGMTATQMRDELLADLQALGVSAVASGPAGIEIAMQSADDNLLEWGESDEGVETIGSLSTD